MSPGISYVLGVMASTGIDGAPGRAATVILEPSETRPPMQIPIFISFMVMGLFQPFSDFVMEILRTYRLRLLHLTPRAVLQLAVFAHACETFVGVMPSMDLFHHFFYPCIDKDGWMGGGVTLCFRLLIKLAYPLMPTKSKWEEWRENWFLVEVPEALPYLAEPVEYH